MTNTLRTAPSRDCPRRAGSVRPPPGSRSCHLPLRRLLIVRSVVLASYSCSGGDPHSLLSECGASPTLSLFRGGVYPVSLLSSFSCLARLFPAVGTAPERSRRGLMVGRYSSSRELQSWHWAPSSRARGTAEHRGRVQ